MMLSDVYSRDTSSGRGVSDSKGEESEERESEREGCLGEFVNISPTVRFKS